MLIQCQSCNTKYRINLERLPKRKTFVKCKKCNGPIFIDPAEETPGSFSQSERTPQTPPEQQEGLLVACENCGAKYRVPPEPLKNPNLQLKCSQCGHVFSVSVEAPKEPVAEPPSPPQPEFYSSASPETEPEKEKLKEIEMPLPDESRMDNLFHDLQADHPAAHLFGKALGEAGVDELAERAYMDSISLDEPGGGTFVPKGTIPKEQREKFFLKPGAEKLKAESQTEGDLPPLSEDDLRSEASAEGSPVFAAEDLPPLPETSLPEDGPADNVPPENTPSDSLPPLPGDDSPEKDLPLAGESQRPEGGGAGSGGGTSGGGGAGGGDVPPPSDLPHLEIQVPDEPPPQAQTEGPNRDPVPGQEEFAKVEAGRFMGLMILAIIFLALSGVGWFFSDGGNVESQKFTLQPGQLMELSLEGVTKGEMVVNNPSKENLFFINGTIKNGFPTGEKVGWLRLKAIAFNKKGTSLGEGYAYAGNNLSREQLSTWEKSAVDAYHGYSNGRNDTNYQIANGRQVPFQIIIPNLKQKPVRTQVVVQSFMRKGNQIFLEAF